MGVGVRILVYPLSFISFSIPFTSSNSLCIMLDSLRIESITFSTFFIVYTLNRVWIKKGMEKMPYELWLDSHHQLSILGYLGENVTLREMMKLVSLFQGVMKVCFLVIH